MISWNETDMKEDELLKDLNSAQKEAVTAGQGPLLIVAGAGTGKTTVITRRIAWLIAQGLAKPGEILALTFTDKAAGEMEERVDRLLPMGYVDIPISTFHAFGERILRDFALDIGLPNQFRVLTGSEQWMLVHDNLSRFNLDYYRPRGNPTHFIHALIQHFSRAKDEEISPSAYLKYVEGLKLDADSDVGADPEEAKRLREVADAYHVYTQLLLEHSALDFGDLINYTLQLLRTRAKVRKELQARYKYILVDEFQDTNYAQYELVKLLSGEAGNITVVGDDDQAIYKFRGASISNILEFKKDYPRSKEVVLTENFRSMQTILDISYKFIQQNNPYRLEVKLATSKGTALSKKLVSARKGVGEIEHLCFPNAQDEAEGVMKKILALRKTHDCLWSDFAILVRANSSAALFLHALKRHGIPFEYVANRGLYYEAVIAEVLEYLKFLDNHEDSHALYKVLTTEPFLIPHEDIVKLTAHAHQKTISLYGALAHGKEVSVSEGGMTRLAELNRVRADHAAYGRERSAAELYVKIVHDLGIEARVAHPALVRDAQYLASFYERIRRFELDRTDHSLHHFLEYLALELESGEEGQLPADNEEGPDTVKVITVHSAKGLEWRFVFVVQLIDRRFPSTERKDPIELPLALIKEILPEGDVHLQEERRLFYVALTRARDGVYLTRAENYFGKTTRKPSRFLFELGFVKEEEKKTARTKGTAVSASKFPAIITPVPTGPARYPLPESFSFSSVSAFRKCPLEYKFRYLLRLPSPGHAVLSFGVTIHKALEEFLKIWQGRMNMTQGDLFSGGKKGALALPTFAELKGIYERVWIDDWYRDRAQKEEYRNVKGPRQLQHFYDNFVAEKPTPKYLEKFFKIAMGPYKFVGKIDRIDKGKEGSVIIDYKTGETNPEKLQKVDKDQLIVYQIAAQEFLNERVEKMMYWYLEPNAFSEPFVATVAQTEKLREEYVETMDEIMETIKSDSFNQAERDASTHTCKFEHLL